MTRTPFGIHFGGLPTNRQHGFVKHCAASLHRTMQWRRVGGAAAETATVFKSESRLGDSNSVRQARHSLVDLAAGLPPRSTY